MEPITLILLGAGGYYVWKKNENPEWSPVAWLTSTPHDKHLALERVKVASVPTPAPTAALDPGMSTDQVKQVNHTLTNETDHEKIKAHADALDSLGHASSAAALDAKAKAVGEAKAHGASDAEIHGKQIEASAPAAVGWGHGEMPTPFGRGGPPYGFGYGGGGGHGVHGNWPYGVGWGHGEMPTPFGRGGPPYGLGYGGGGGHGGWPYGGYGYDYDDYGPYMTGIQSGPAIVGIQSGPAIVGIQSGPAIVGWDLFAHGVPAGGSSRPGWGHPQHHPQHQRDWGRHGRVQHGRARWEHQRQRPEWEQWRHHRRFRRPE
jgi:hypothetical protein